MRGNRERTVTNWPRENTSANIEDGFVLGKITQRGSAVDLANT